MKKLIWLDDIRNPYTDNWLRDYTPQFTSGDSEVVWVKNFNEFVKEISYRGLPDTISFDHDLGEDVAREKVKSGISKRQARLQKKETKSGYDCAKWLVEYCMDKNLPIPNFVVHSANPVGAENIRGLLNNARKHI